MRPIIIGNSIYVERELRGPASEMLSIGRTTAARLTRRFQEGGRRREEGGGRREEGGGRREEGGGRREEGGRTRGEGSTRD
jgi:hypothetical protein